jgi:hypothetical protein
MQIDRNRVDCIAADVRVADDAPAGFRPGEAVAANEEDIALVNDARTDQARRLGAPVFFMSAMLLMYAGWQNRGSVYLTPEQGAGYYLGIAGGTLMLLLLLYPLRKHLRWMHCLGPVRYWFRAHMLMGVLGPVCILYHCNFRLGSTNGNIALFSMLLVAGSGLVGRYFYTRIHYGLYGQKADLERLGSETVKIRSRMDMVFTIIPELQERLRKLEDRAMAHPQGLVSGVLRVFVIGFRTRWCWLVSGVRLQSAFAAMQRRRLITREQRWHYLRRARIYLRIHLGTVRKIAGFSFYERLFSLWHVLHLPLFIMLLVSGVVHVYAVHMY